MARRRQRRSIHWAAYLWPGLPHLWIAGSWAGLVLALGFAVLLNLLLVSTFVWIEWLPPRVKLAFAAILGTIWLAALGETRRELRRIAARRQQPAEEAEVSEETHPKSEIKIEARAEALFRQAQADYLVGDWLAAERTLSELLQLDRRDIEGHLLLATLWRHSGRWAEAERQLCRLERLEDVAPWQFEIGRERELIAAARGGRSTDDLSPPNGETSPLAA